MWTRDGVVKLTHLQAGIASDIKSVSQQDFGFGFFHICGFKRSKMCLASAEDNEATDR